jgi:4-hydroxybenzoate polyprenyltransferase
MLKDIIKTARPLHYTKNLFVFAALIFSKKFVQLENIIPVLVTFISFCLAASAVYFLNDIYDKKEDLLHPTKKYRPIASGRISISTGLSVCFVLAVASLLISLIAVNKIVAFIILSYLIINIFYSWKLKHIVILDLFVVSLGFVLRVVAGGYAIGINISEWLLICVILLALFLAIAKRREEYVTTDFNNSNNLYTRKVIIDYEEKLLDQMIAIVSSLTIISYLLYTMLNKNFKHLIYTVPFVLYGIFRYLYIIYKKQGGAKPEKEMLTDKHILVTVILWVVQVIIISYFQ